MNLSADDRQPAKPPASAQGGPAAGKDQGLKLGGKTLRVYLYLLKSGPSELREVQHALQMSTGSLAVYHLNRLLQAGYVEQDQAGRYAPVRGSVSGVLEGYSRVGFAILPQLFFYSLLFSILVIFFSVELVLDPVFSPYPLIASAGGAVCALWLETVRLWRKLAP
ncbi:MAG: winged helix-turn-helix transcriptional regulator [Nitrososphaerota archaeon]|nr:winged helix-turn-helix transcriptional regulator [Nitrososphaerota archaeon]